MNSFSIDIPGFTIAGKAWGNSNLPPMLALHGWLDNANSFDLLAPYLEKQFHLLAIDLPGHGHSSHLGAGCNYHFIDGIFTTMQIIKALGYPQIHLLGHSMGACLASLISGVAPDKILSMVLIEGLGPFSHPEELCCEQLGKYLHYALRGNSRTTAYPSVKKAAQARAQRGYLSLGHAEILCQRGVEKRENDFYWRHDRRLLTPTPLRMTEGQILSCLAQIKAKSCLLWADEGFSFGNETMKSRVNAIKNLEVHQLKGGHHLHMEKPDTVAQCLVEFYKRL